MLMILFDFFPPQSDVRGNGYSIIFHNAVHFNLSGALIRTLNDLLRTTQLEESGVADNDEVSLKSYRVYKLLPLTWWVSYRKKALTKTNQPQLGINAIQVAHTCGMYVIPVLLSIWVVPIP